MSSESDIDAERGVVDSVCAFTFDHFGEMLSSARAAGYTFSSFEGDWTDDPTVYLRHDVDISPENALRLGEIEKKVEVAASFFFQLNTPLYNVFYGRTREIVWALYEMGHTIGIHLDAAILRKTDPDQGDLEAALGSLHGLMAQHFPVARVFSIHRPPPFVLGRSFEGFTSVYEKRFFTDIEYNSDSRKSWRAGCPHGGLGSREWPRLQLLVHPCWWNDEDLDFSSLGTLFLETQRRNAVEYLTANITPFREVLE